MAVIGFAKFRSFTLSDVTLCAMIEVTGFESVNNYVEYETQNVPLDSDQPGTWRDAIIAGSVARLNELGLTNITENNLYLADFEPASQPDQYLESMVAAWTKDVTKTNIGETYVNVYAGLGGEIQGVSFTGYKQYILTVHVNKVGTGTQDAALVDASNAANLLSVSDTGTAGEHLLSSGWTTLPAWATGSINLKPMARSSVAADDPVYRQFVLYLK